MTDVIYNLWADLGNQLAKLNNHGNKKRILEDIESIANDIQHVASLMAEKK